MISYAGYVLDEDPVHAALIDAYEVTDIDEIFRWFYGK